MDDAISYMNCRAAFVAACRTAYAHLIRDHGRLRIESDHWTMGIFSLETWRQVLRETGRQVHEGQYSSGEDEYTVFVCVKD